MAFAPGEHTSCHLPRPTGGIPWDAKTRAAGSRRAVTTGPRPESDSDQPGPDAQRPGTAIPATTSRRQEPFVPWSGRHAAAAEHRDGDRMQPALPLNRGQPRLHSECSLVRDSARRRGPPLGRAQMLPRSRSSPPSRPSRPCSATGCLPLRGRVGELPLGAHGTEEGLPLLPPPRRNRPPSGKPHRLPYQALPSPGGAPAWPHPISPPATCPAPSPRAGATRRRQSRPRRPRRPRRVCVQAFFWFPLDGLTIASA